MLSSRRSTTWATVCIAVAAVVAIAVESGSGSRGHESVTTSTTTTATTAPTTAPSRAVPTTRPTFAPPTPVTPASMSLQRSAVAVPLTIQIPSIGVNSGILAVGMTKAHAMAAPEGGASSPYWGDTFWYRGSSVPGASGTATIAGHIDDRYGRYAVFGRLSSLVRGDRIIIRNTRTGLVERFVVTVVHVYTLAQSTTLPVLDLMYGYGPPHGRRAMPSKNGVAHLSLITCAGSWDSRASTHNERLVVSAVRTS